MRFQPQIAHSIVHAESILTLAKEAWDIAPTSAILLNSGFNDTYLLKSSEKAWIFRLYRLNRWSREGIEEELEALRKLQRAGVQVAAPLAARDGEWTKLMECPEGPRQAALFPWIKGGMPFPLSDVQASIHGRLLAEIHPCFSKSLFRHRWTINRETMFLHALSCLASAFPDREQEIAELKNRLDFGDQLTSHDEDIQRLHGDFVFINLVGRDAETTVIDFDFAGNGSLLYDLAMYHWGISVHLSGPELARVWESFLAGYRSVRPISFEAGILERWAIWRELWLWADPG